MSPQYYYIAYFPDSTVYSFESLQTIIKEAMDNTAYSIEFERDESMAGLMQETGILPENTLTEDAILIMDGWPVMFGFEKGDHVREEAAQLQKRVSGAAPKNRSALRECNQRLEIWCEEDDPDLVYFNDMLLLIGKIEVRWNAVLVEGNSEAYV